MKILKKHFFVVIIFILMTILFAVVVTNNLESRSQIISRKIITKTGVCPPFYLFTEDGDTINPVIGKNIDKPYSPKQTCGKCHNYDLITEGFHFQQGKDEKVSSLYAERYQWVTHPGNYGGNWCSPAPLYNFLSPKNNSNATEMDMTSFSFITNGCGTCHPGSGSFEFDRSGFRYDKFMDSLGYKSGGINNYDGDYYKSFWNRSGVAEADCFLCHLPEYDYKKRNQHLLLYNFKWLATVGSGLATVEGSVKDSIPIVVKYNASKFDKDGKLSAHIVREPRNETCLNCHAKPQWKKRGASFTTFTDVHIAKGLKCVDCHPAGSMATDKRIAGKEKHQFAKGDDPSGMVRNDLDNTMRTCSDCHLTGYLNAPIAKHSWLPALHLEELSCQACHIPERNVKAALVQASDVYNPGTKIKPPAKYVWTFYDQNLNYWNHYGELEMFTNKDQPVNPFVPQYAKYKGQIFPVNPVHSAWPAIYTKGKKGLNQPRQKDIYDMWVKHKKNKTKYQSLSKISDDNNDSIPEVNRPEEIDAFIVAVSQYLKEMGYDLSQKQVVWVNNDRIYFNGKDYEMLDKEIYESTPYASVYKFNHDVFPANAALGAKGCTECHSFASDNMFYRQIVKYPFGEEDAKPVFEPQYKRLGKSAAMVFLSALREQYLKTIEYAMVLFLLIIIALSLALQWNQKVQWIKINILQLHLFYIGIALALLFIYWKPDLNSYILPQRLWLDANHFILSIIPFFAGIIMLLNLKKKEKTKKIYYIMQLFFVSLAAISGFFMLIKFDAIETIVAISYTIFDAAIIAISIIFVLYMLQLNNRKLSKLKVTF